MTVNDAPQGRTVPQTAKVRRPSSALARSALLAGGAATGLAASALAGFGLVGLMFPNGGLPGTGGAPMTAAAYVPVEVAVMPEMQAAHYALDPVPAPVVLAPVAPTPAAFSEAEAEADTPAALAATSRDAQRMMAHETRATPVPTEAHSVAPTPEETVATAPADRVDPRGDETDLAADRTTDLTTDEGPRIAALPAPSEPTGNAPETAAFGPRISALPARAAPAAPAETAADPDQPQDFAMLADDDAAARAGAGLFSEAAVAPAAIRPEATGAVTDTADDAAEIAPMRPARRPEGFADQVAADIPTQIPTPSAAPTTSIRPAPRPNILLAAAPAPAPAAPAAPQDVPEIAAPTGVVEVAARQRPSGIISGGSANCGRNLARAMPSRRGGATGSAFFAGLTNVSGPDRDARVISELARGNMPGFLRNLRPVTFTGQDGRGAQVAITICVTPDYLALGSDKDYVRVPLGLPAAAKIAGAFNMTLPTPRMVDAIYAQANVHLSPAPMPAGAQMSSTNYFVTHNATIESQLQGRRGLVGGHKKDVVMASRMASAPGRVAIYGWHRSNGAPIQPVSTVHGANYADYSHGIRLVSKTAYLNGKAVSLDELLASSRYAHLLNTGGPMPGPVIRVASN